MIFSSTLLATALLSGGSGASVPASVNFEVRQHIPVRNWSWASSSSMVGNEPPCQGASVFWNSLQQEFLMFADGTFQERSASINSRAAALPQDALRLYCPLPTEKPQFRHVALRFDARFAPSSGPLELYAQISDGQTTRTEVLNPDATNRFAYVTYALSIPAPPDGALRSYSVSLKLRNLSGNGTPVTGLAFVRDVGIMATTDPVFNLNCYVAGSFLPENGICYTGQVDVEACGDQYPLNAIAWNNGFCDFNGDGHVNPMDQNIFNAGLSAGNNLFDLNHDSFLNSQDTTIFLDRMANDCGAVYGVFPCAGGGTGTGQ